MRKSLIGVLAGVLLFGLVRFAVAPLNTTTHHHANWAVVIDGQPVDLSGDQFMEEISACSASDTGILPQQRVHMHEGDGGLVHVHHPGATWGALMANLGMAMGEDYLFLADGRRFYNGAEGRMNFIVNGFAVADISNRVIQSTDRALISFSTRGPDELLQTEFAQVRDDAAEFNERMDPASCSGGHGDLTLLERLKLAFWG